ncbi:MaoC family dehydratase [Sphingomonas sp. 3-13AW]|jgi:acyl dehydratase|uniref:MaoC family dehydratase n=1 Tax=Sphingomonas sp. 3-13AW TaxID=3050450 RepID=UPI003BB4A6A7
MRYFEDIVEGETARFGRYEVTREEVLDFARRYDPQPFHLSDEGAAETHFGRLAASGWHSCAMAMAMLVEEMKVHPQASLGAAGVDELRWLRPVHPGDTLRCETEVLEKRASASRPEMGILRTRVTLFNQDDVAVLRFIASALLRTRQAPAD